MTARARAATEARRRLRRQVLQAYREDPTLQAAVLDARVERPRFRGECVEGPRPCPWVACRYHLAYDVSPAGGLKANFPGRALEALAETCALDVADRGGVTLEEIAAAMNLVRERVRQVESVVLQRLRREMGDDSLDIDTLAE